MDRIVLQNKSDIMVWLDNLKISHYTIQEDLTVDVDNSVHLGGISIPYIPFQFGSVSGSFNCANIKLLSLEGSPRRLGGDFYCHDNLLTSLKGAPSEMRGSFDCSYNQLTNLLFAPEISEDFICSHNLLTSLEGAPTITTSRFSCAHNQLKNLQYCPQRVGTSFLCSDNQLTSLEFFPKKIGSNVYCGENPGLGDLQKEYRFAIFYEAHQAIVKIKEEQQMLKTSLQPDQSDIQQTNLVRKDTFKI